MGSSFAGRRVRAWFAYLIGLLALLGLGGAGLAASSDTDRPAVAAQTAETDAAGDAVGHAVENHGRCVSRAAKAAKDAGVKGRAKGAFMSAIAGDDAQVADKDGAGACSFDDALAEAVAETQAAEEAKAQRKADAKARGEQISADAKVRRGPPVSND